ncbi:UBX domain protein [Penicillium taxi]|uniref:UBX domain protein n=1 Tax=Penicillium taxi TaxID=168475 RepID=UPI0025458409|nr:UBX domain protein [Penicillium taxi]KAJ5902294.1 UBX domain protein [Penicillium taxi]
MDDDLVAQFTEITGSTPELATQYLQLTDFNIEQALPLYFENGGAQLTEPARPTERARHEDEAGVIHVGSDTDDDIRVGEDSLQDTNATFEDDAAMARRLQEEMYGGGGANNLDDDGVRAPMARTTETLVGPEADDADFPADIFSQMRSRSDRRGRPGIFNQRDTSSIWNQGSAASHQEQLSRATGGASDESNKSNMLAEMYRPPFEIMSRLPWDAARQEGKDNQKWLLVNIQDSSIFDCQVLNRDLWKNKAVQETVKEHFIFLQFSKDDPRALSYLQYYFQGHNVSDNFPHISIVDPRTGEQMKVWSGAPVVKSSDFLIQLHEFLDRYSLNNNVRNPIAKRKSEKKEVNLDAMTEEEMMEWALRNSLGEEQSSERKTEDLDDLTRSIDDVKGKARATDEDDTMDEKADDPESSAFSAIPSDQLHTEPAVDPATTTRIQFRHPSGRIIRRFALADPVQRIYEWLKAEPLEDKAGVAFELNAMGRNLMDKLSTSIEDAGLKNGTVMIGFLED